MLSVTVASVRRIALASFAASSSVLAALMAPATAAEDGLDLAMAQMRHLTVSASSTILAADASGEGHWTFLNAKGERFTASKPDEMARMQANLAPEAKPDGKLVIGITEASAFAQPKVLALLPGEASLRLATSAGLLEFLAGPPARVRINPRIEVQIADRPSFQTMLGQLERSVASGGLRVLALEPGAPASLASRPASNGWPEIVERIDPLRLKEAVAHMRRQTVLLTGRVDGKLLYIQTSGGPNRSIILGDIVAAAQDADADLIVLETSSGRQPGTRNWLWQRSEVRGVQSLPSVARVDSLIETLVGQPLTLTLRDASETRVAMTATPISLGSGADALASRLSRAAADLSNTVTGRIEPISVMMSLVPLQRQRELDRRLIRWLPSWVAWGYLALAALGLAAWRTSWRWWSKLWPPEQPSDYPGVIGLQLARATRVIVFLILFMPVAALGALPAYLLTLRGRENPRTA